MQCLVKGARNVKSVTVSSGSTLRTATSRNGFKTIKSSTQLNRSTRIVAPLIETNDILQRSFSTEVKPAYDPTELENREHNANLLRLITAYRRYGHILADLDPLGLEKKSPPPELDLSRYGLNKIPKDKQFPLPGLIKIGNKKSATLEEILTHLKNVYCGKIGTEFLYTQQVDQRKWFSDQIEDLPFRTLSKEEKLRAYKLLAEAEAFDHFMQKKFPFIKRYALEGTESMMVAIDQVFDLSAKSGVDNVAIGMPHRGRLNFLVDLLQYPARQLFWKVKGNSELPPNALGIGDVLSHIGQSVDLDYSGKKLHVNLLQNPSHLEAITPVTLGKARAKQEYASDRDGDKTVAVLFHGDASFYGQGTIAESLILSKLPEFKTGGAVHIIVNNQLGFTTAPTQARSSRYSADVGKMIDVPVIHVNADHPEEVAKAVRVAVEFRQKFKEDIIIDIIGYRRHGHNELDEPSFTSPLMYNKIRSRPSVVKLYGEQLIKEGILTSEQSSDIITKETNRLEEELKNASGPKTATHLLGKWKGLEQPRDVTKPVDTGVKEDVLRKIAEKSVEVPSGFEVHERLRRTFAKKRLDDVSKDNLDWATCEALAFGSLLLEGHNARICGQDVGRGTFSQRHFELVDQNTEKRHLPLNHISPSQSGKLKSVNSPLSELAVLGFEYGYSVEDPNNLVIWEAQFGDFANGAQVMIDQFISSGEPKWLQQTGMVVLLPHGYDGAGPEHSNSRPERFLQLIEGDALNNKNPINKTTNMYVANASTPANYFHLLRRQLKTNYRKPLIVMSPKTILRASKAVSKFSDIVPGTHFLPVIGDNVNADSVKRVVLVSGKLYYELAEEREKRGYSDTALVRVEEFAPFPIDQIEAEINKYKNAEKFIWAQEEPQNGGFWFYVEPRLSQVRKFEYIGRPACPASAVGTSVANKQEYENLMNAVFPKK